MDQLNEAFSLKRQLAYQRDIISKLIDRPKQDTSRSQTRFPSGKSTHATCVTKNETKTKLSNKSSTNDQMIKTSAQTNFNMTDTDVYVPGKSLKLKLNSRLITLYLNIKSKIFCINKIIRKLFKDDIS